MTKVAIITVWHNEEDLAPFFLKHYNYVDNILLYLDTNTSDATRSICETYSNVTIRDISFPGGYDSIIKVDKINSMVRELDGYDWIYAVDADEFIFPPKQYKDTKDFLFRQEQEGYNLIFAQMFQVFRHFTDRDLDPSKPVLPQRSHGDPDLNSAYNRFYIKPIVAKPETGISWSPGCHIFTGDHIRVAEEKFHGAHWKMADEGIAIKRRIGNKLRFSERQITMRMGYQDIDITEEDILEELEGHKHDPDVLSSLLSSAEVSGNG